MREPGKDTQIEQAGPQRVKIYGERNTGTSYFEALLVRNLHVDCLRGGVPRSIRRLFPESEIVRDWYFRATDWRNLGWKHAIPNPNQRRTPRRDSPLPLFLTLTKNPYAWLLSLYRQPYHAKRKYSSFEQFLNEPWETVRRENAPAAFTSPIEMWNQKNAAYLELAGHATVVHCRYEDLLADPLGFLDGLCSQHGMQPRSRPFENVHEAMKKRDRGKTFDDYRTYYLNERWRGELDDDCVQLINEGLDAEVLSRFQYSRLAIGSERRLANLTRTSHD